MTRSSLSVCCLANAPGPFLRAALEPLREIADEIVIAAGGPVAEEDLQCYGDVADLVFSIEFAFVERHLAWLHEQCRGDWILRLDGDEIPSPEMIQEVLAAKNDRRLSSVLFARRTLFPTIERYIVQEPWYPDFQVRMVRNDGSLRFSGLMHSAAERTMPARMVEAPIYHLPFILGSVEERRARAERYEQLRPGLVAPTGLPANDALVPEILSEPVTAEVPIEDQHLLQSVLSAAGPARGVTEVLSVTLPTMDSLWAGRALPAGALRASISLLGTPVPFYPGERRPVYFKVHNLGTERWGWDPSIAPYLHVVHRVVSPEGTPLDDWRPSFFTEWVKPGMQTVIPGHVDAPSEPGLYRLEVRLRHAPDHLFGESPEVELEVTAEGAWKRR
jgi:hypothetical protein